MKSVKELKFPDLSIQSDLEYLDTVVYPDWQDFNVSIGIRETFHLASSLNSLVEWHWHSLNPEASEIEAKKGVSALRKALSQVCPATATIRDICDASKHVGLSRNDMILTGLRPTIGRGGFGGLNSPSMGYGVAGALGSGQSEPVVHASHQSPQWVREVFQAALDYWVQTIAARRGLVATNGVGS